MGKNFDIFNNPTVSQVIKGIEGKLILIHSDERKLGKTVQGCNMPKPFVLRFENGMNAISGVPFAGLESWSDFKKVNRQLTKNPEKTREHYTTIVVDTTDVAIKWCEQYVCSRYEVSRLKDGNDGYGLWKEFETEWFSEFNKLINAGFCIYFIAHSETKKFKHPVTGEQYEQMTPKGDKRSIDLVLDAVDFIGYVKSNGIDEETGDIAMSSCYFMNTPEFRSGSRFKYMSQEVTPFTAENLQKSIIEAIEKEEKETGVKGVTAEEMKKQTKKKEYTHPEILKAITPYLSAAWEDYQEQVEDIFEELLGDRDVKLGETSKKQIPQLEMVLYDLKTLCEDNELEVE